MTLTYTYTTLAKVSHPFHSLQSLLPTEKQRFLGPMEQHITGPLPSGSMSSPNSRKTMCLVSIIPLQWLVGKAGLPKSLAHGQHHSSYGRCLTTTFSTLQVSLPGPAPSPPTPQPRLLSTGLWKSLLPSPPHLFFYSQPLRSYRTILGFSLLSTLHQQPPQQLFLDPELCLCVLQISLSLLVMGAFTPSH